MSIEAITPFNCLSRTVEQVFIKMCKSLFGLLQKEQAWSSIKYVFVYLITMTNAPRGGMCSFICHTVIEAFI